MLTINQQPVVAADYGEHGDRSKEARLASIASEITERLEEMEQIKMQSAGTLISKLASVRMISPVVFRMVIQLLHGNTAALESYGQRADLRGVSKQQVYLECVNELHKASHHFPNITAMFMAMQAHALSHEDPMSNADAIREGKEAGG
jgi:hypothetical protein